MKLDTPWIKIAGAVFGGLILGFGLIRFSLDYSLLSVLIMVAGFLLLWWVFGDWRRLRRGTPESEVDGGKTIE